MAFDKVRFYKSVKKENPTSVLLHGTIINKNTLTFKDTKAAQDSLVYMNEYLCNNPVIFKDSLNIVYSDRQWESLRKAIRNKASVLKIPGIFGIKSLRGDSYCYAEQEFKELVNPKDQFPKRRGIKSDFTVDGHGVKSRVPNTEYPLKTPQYTEEEKKDFTNSQSVSVGKEGLLPEVFGFNNRKDLLVGIILFERNILWSNRLYIYDGGTVNRCYDKTDGKLAEEYAKKVVNKKLFKSEDLRQFLEAFRNGSAEFNEALARLKLTCEGAFNLFIASDNLESRLLARQYWTTLLGLLHSAGKLPDNHQIRIYFYTPNNPELLFREYTEHEYALDCLEARYIASSSELIKQKLDEKKFEFLYALTQEELQPILDCQCDGLPFVVSLLKNNYVHVFTFLSEKCDLNLQKHLNIIKLRQDSLDINLVILENVLKKNNLPLVKAILDEFKHPSNKLFRNIDKLLLDCIEHNRISIFKELILHYTRDSGELLLTATQYGRVEIVKYILKYKHQKIEWTAEGSRTPLMVAVRYHRTKIVQLLLEAGRCKIDAVDRNGDTPLIVATRFGYVDIVSLLLKNQNVTTKAISGKRKEACELAIGSENPDMIHLYEKYILETGMNMDDVFILFVRMGCSVDSIHFILASGIKEELVDQALLIACKKGYTAIARLLLTLKNPGKDLNTQCLMIAIRLNYPDIVELLLDYPVGLNERDKEGDTPLLLAASRGYTDIVTRLLLKPEIHIEDTDKAGKTALLLSIEAGHLKTAAVLLCFHANTEVSNADAQTPLIIACSRGYEETLVLLLKFKANIRVKDRFLDTALIHAAHKGHPNIVSILLDNHIDVAEKNKEGKGALDYAITNNHPKIVKQLLHRISDVDLNAQYKVDFLFDTAIIMGYVKIVELLLKRKVLSDKAVDLCLMKIIRNSDNYTSEGYTKVFGLFLDVTKNSIGIEVFLLAIRNHYYNMVKRFLESGKVNINEKSSEGMTPLFCAIQAGHTKIVKLLLEYNPDLSKLTSKGETASENARAHAHSELAALLEGSEKANKIIKKSSSGRKNSTIAEEIAEAFFTYAHPPMFSSWRNHCKTADSIARHLFLNTNANHKECMAYIHETVSAIPKKEYNLSGTFARMVYWAEHLEMWRGVECK